MIYKGFFTIYSSFSQDGIIVMAMGQIGQVISGLGGRG
jgi:hypothetical protein